MKIGILADTHNDIKNTQRAMQVFSNHQVGLLIHCGDVTSVTTLKWLSEFPIILTFGNGDVFSGEMKAYLESLDMDCVAGYKYEGELGGKRIAASHGHLSEINNSILSEQTFDFFFHGHTHEKVDRWVGRTRVINPGAVMAIGKSIGSVCVLDLAGGELIFETLS
ncbi:MAG: hypothetical protein BGO78_06610 [Chloroflexi bacterium 44-23]|nr:MAG: hypothetical protein BGO78_06610 [Chloroflexi bacterium 44-23]